MGSEIRLEILDWWSEIVEVTDVYQDESFQ